MGVLLIALSGLLLVSWPLSTEAPATPIICSLCNDVTDLSKCTTEKCTGIEDGCYYQLNRETKGHHTQITVHARCISDHTCHFPETWHGMKTWSGEWLENGCCFGSHQCNIPLYTKAFHARTHQVNHPSTQAPKARTHQVNHPSTQAPKVNHYCTLCEGASSLSQCKTHQLCTGGQDKCFMQVNREPNGVVEMFARCAKSDVCSTLHGETWSRNEHFQTDVCEECCSGDNCNNQLCQGSSPYAAVTTPSPSTVPYRLTHGIDCSVCTGGACQQGPEATSKCPDAFPYCMNMVQNDVNGNKLITKRCASEATCQKQWWEETSRHSICSVLDPYMTYRTTFTCNYCCLTPDCNRDLHPDPSTLFIGTNN